MDGWMIPNNLLTSRVFKLDGIDVQVRFDHGGRHSESEVGSSDGDEEQQPLAPPSRISGGGSSVPVAWED